jgi:mannose/cellobiose epimerase-like protein (N-acyl-D-glucosamine 2-epimerase family)
MTESHPRAKINLDHGHAISATVVQGRVIGVAERELRLQTSHGDLVLRRNASTRVDLFSAVTWDGIGRTPIDWSIELIGHRCIAEIVLPVQAGIANGAPALDLALTSFGPWDNETITNPQFHQTASQWLARFWLENALDTGSGGIFTNVLWGGGRPKGPERDDKWSYITSRHVAGFSFAFQLSGERRFLDAAWHAMRFLEENSVRIINDELFFHSRQARNGQPHPDAAPYVNFFVQTYALTGPLRLFAATGDRRLQDFVAKGLDAAMLFRDPDFGGFYDALDPVSLAPAFGVTSTKSFTSSADGVAAAFGFAMDLGVTGRRCQPAEVCREVADILVARHMQRGKPFIVESFDRDWGANTSTWRNEYATCDIAGNLGAAAKVARVLAAGLPLLKGDRRTQADAALQNLLEQLLATAYDPLRGGVYDVMLRENSAGPEMVFHAGYVWWVMEQMIWAAYSAYFCYRQHRWLEVARSILCFWYRFFLPWEGGVHDTVDHAGNPVSPRMGSYVKGSYHELETAWIAAAFEAAVAGSPITLYFEGDHPGPYAGSLPSIPSVQWEVLDRQSSHGTLAVTLLPKPAGA